MDVIRLRIRIQEFLKRVLRHCEIRHFSTIQLTFPEKLIEPLRKLYHRGIFRQRSPRYILEAIRIRRSGPDLLWRRHALSKCSCPVMKMFLAVNLLRSASIAVTVGRKNTGGCELFSVKSDVASRLKEQQGRPADRGPAVMSTSDICLFV